MQQRRRGAGLGARPARLPNLPRRLPHTDPACSPRPGLRRGKRILNGGRGFYEGRKGHPRAAHLGTANTAAAQRRPRRSGLAHAHAHALPQSLHAAPAAARASGGGESGTGKEVARGRGESHGNGAVPEAPRGAAPRGGRHTARRADPAPAAGGREACPTTLLSNGKGRGKRVISAPSAARCPARVLLLLPLGC